MWNNCYHCNRANGTWDVRIHTQSFIHRHGHTQAGSSISKQVCIIRWPRELNALQLQKTHANRKSTSKSRKHFHQFDSRWCKCSQRKQIKKHTAKCSQHNQIHFICSAFLFWLCCEHLQRVCCQIDESVFLICRCFFYLQCVELSRPP